jgi:hypothetical protein
MWFSMNAHLFKVFVCLFFSSLPRRFWDFKVTLNVELILNSLIAAWAIFQLSGGCHHYRWLGSKFRPMLGAQGLWAGRDLYRATPTATRDLGLYGLIRKTGTHVPVGFEPPTQGSSDLWARRSNHCATRAACFWLLLKDSASGIHCITKCGGYIPIFDFSQPHFFSI